MIFVRWQGVLLGLNGGFSFSIIYFRFDLQLDKEGKTKGMAVCEYSHPIEAVQAVSMLNNQRLFDRTIAVRMDRYPKEVERREGGLPVCLTIMITMPYLIVSQLFIWVSSQIFFSLDCGRLGWVLVRMELH